MIPDRIWIVTWLLMLTKSVHLEKDGRENDDESGWWHKNRNIVYDVYDVILKNQTTNFNNLLEPSAQVDSAHPILFYHELKVNISEQSCSWSIVDGVEVAVPCKNYGINGFAVILNEKAKVEDVTALSLLSMTKHTIKNLLRMDRSIIESVIFSVDFTSCNLTNGEFLSLLENILNTGIKTTVKVGLEYDEHLLECFGQSSNVSYRLLHDIVVKLEVTPLTTMLSYAVFSEMMENAVTKLQQFGKHLSFTGTLYIRPVIRNWETSISGQHYSRYEALIMNFFQSWTTEVTGNEKYILRQPVEQNSIQRNVDFYKKRVMEVNLKYNKGSFRYQQSKDIRQWTCESPELKDNMYSLYDEILFLYPAFSSFDIAQGDCLLEYGQRYKKIQPEENENLISISFYDVSFGDISNDLKELREMIVSNEINSKTEKIIKSKVLVPKIRAVYFQNTYVSLWQKNITEFNNLTEFLQSRNITIGCSFEVEQEKIQQTPFDQFVQKECGSIYEIATEFVFPVDVKFKQNVDLINFLTSFERRKNLFEKKHSVKHLVPNFGPGQQYYEKGRSLFYCNPDIQKNHKDCQTVLSFANVHNWTKLMLVPKSSSTFKTFEDGYLGFWQTIDTDIIVEQSAKDYPIFFRTNFREPVDDEFMFTYDCIERTINATKNINFVENSKIGTSFEAALRLRTPINNREMLTLLVVAIERFSVVEVIVNGKESFKLLENLLTTADLKGIQRSLGLVGSQSSFYIEVPTTVFPNIRNDVEKFSERSDIAVHLSGWECDHSNLIKWKFDNKLSFKLWLTVQDCGYEMNLQFERLLKLSFIGSVNYIVCNVKPVVPQNVDQIWMQKYMGTLFYTKVYMEKFFPAENKTKDRIDVWFRINLNSATARCSNKDRGDTERFLRFLTDLYQHSKFYDMKYFIVRAFETDETASECPYSWWRVKDYQDLTNTSVYVDKEREYLGLDTTVKFNIPEDSTNDADNRDGSNLNYLFNIPVFLVLVLVIILLWVKLRRTQKQFLTQKEINDFYNGAQFIDGRMEMTNSTCYDPMYSRFQHQYEIRAKDIKIEEMIGCGQFGIVHKGVLRNEIEVAIKVPRSDCGVEQFKSTLSELKMHCYIGTHMNMVSLIGAYTKEIVSGKLYIVLEFCEMGSLLNYLRQCRQRYEKEFTVDMNQLYAFSHQIACGMEYMAGKRVIHGDLATRNVLLTSDYTCKIADFGLSRRLYEMSEYHKTSRDPLPWRWMAVESLKNMEFTTKSDVWSYGVTLWEIFSLGMVPYLGKVWTTDFVSELDNGLRLPKAEHASEEIHDKMLECWNTAQDARPEFVDLIQFFVGIRDREYADMGA